MAFPEPLGEKLYAEVKNFLENHVQSLYEVDMKRYSTYIYLSQAKSEALVGGCCNVGFNSAEQTNLNRTGEGNSFICLFAKCVVKIVECCLVHFVFLLVLTKRKKNRKNR